jgi:TolB protein
VFIVQIKHSIGAVAACAAVVATLISASPAQATTRGISGLIAFQSTRAGGTQDFSMNPDGSAVAQLAKITGLSTRDIAWSPDGSQVAFSGCCTGGGTFQIYKMNADGTGFTQLTTLGRNTLAAWAPGGQRIAFTSKRDGNFEIYTMNSDGTNQVNVTNDPGRDEAPAWSPDGAQIVWGSHRSGKLQVYIMKSDGSLVSNLTNTTSNETEPDFSPDGTKITFESDRTGNHDIFTMNADGTSQTDVTNDSGADDRPVYSPDGTRIAFDTTRTGNAEIFTMNADGTNQTNVTNNSATDQRPDWQPLLPGVKLVTVSDTGFAPAPVGVKRGDTVEFDFSGTMNHTATDNNGLGLFGSGSVPPGGNYEFLFFAAGTYRVIDSVAGNSGIVKVSVGTDPQSGTLTTVFTITWASVTAPTGFLYDVQIRRPGTPGFTSWLMDQTQPSSTFTPDSGVGTYSFRARLRNTTNGNATGYSAASSITVTG